MQARCPRCGTVYAIDRKLLRQAQGLARCYNCGSVFNALQSTLGARAEAPSPPLPRAAVATLSTRRGEPDLPFDVPENLPELQPSARIDLASRDTLHPAARRRMPWWQQILFALLALALAAQIAWLQRDHWIHLPQVIQVCTWLQCPSPLSHRPDLFSVVDREMRALTETVPALRLQLRFRNNADHPLPLARLQLSLLDANGSLVGRRTLSPEEYLPDSWSGPIMALPGEVITIELDLQDPGPRVRSYVFDFV